MLMLRLLLVLFMSIAAPAVAGTLEDADVALRREDYATAMRLYRQLADQGQTYPQFQLGMLYWRGYGAPKDDVASASWYRRAAEQGHGHAMLAIGSRYESGEGVQADYVEAYKWYSLAVSRQSSNRMQKFATFQRDTIGKKLTAAQIAEAQKLARQWKPKPER